jgi:hypothetical protein
LDDFLTCPSEVVLYSQVPLKLRRQLLAKVECGRREEEGKWVRWDRVRSQQLVQQEVGLGGARMIPRFRA